MAIRDFSKMTAQELSALPPEQKAQYESYQYAGMKLRADTTVNSAWKDYTAAVEARVENNNLLAQNPSGTAGYALQETLMKKEAKARKDLAETIDGRMRDIQGQFWSQTPTGIMRRYGNNVQVEALRDHNHDGSITNLVELQIINEALVAGGAAQSTGPVAPIPVAKPVSLTTPASGDQPQAAGGGNTSHHKAGAPTKDENNNKFTSLKLDPTGEIEKLLEGKTPDGKQSYLESQGGDKVRALQAYMVDNKMYDDVAHHKANIRDEIDGRWEERSNHALDNLKAKMAADAKAALAASHQDESAQKNPRGVSVPPNGEGDGVTTTGDADGATLATQPPAPIVHAYRQNYRALPTGVVPPKGIEGFANDGTQGSLKLNKDFSKHLDSTLNAMNQGYKDQFSIYDATHKHGFLNSNHDGLEHGDPRRDGKGVVIEFKGNPAQRAQFESDLIDQAQKQGLGAGQHGTAPNGDPLYIVAPLGPQMDHANGGTLTGSANYGSNAVYLDRSYDVDMQSSLLASGFNVYESAGFGFGGSAVEHRGKEFSGPTPPQDGNHHHHQYGGGSDGGGHPWKSTLGFLTGVGSGNSNHVAFRNNAYNQHTATGGHPASQQHSNATASVSHPKH